MRTLGTLTALPLLLGLAACGSQTDSADAGSSAPPCTGTALGQLSVDGGPEQVRLDGGRLCAGAASTSVRGLDLDASTATTVDLHTGDSVLLVRGAAHPRGGYQPWLVAAGDGRIAVLKADGASVLPYVATDGGGSPMTATCTDDGFAVWTAKAHEPPGIVLAWDVRRTTYTLDGADLETGASELVEDGTADPTMRQKMPQLFDAEGMFSDC